MKVIYGISEFKKTKKPVVALGIFDGLHRGHRVILKAAVEKARQIKGTSLVLTFWPHPQQIESLYSLRHRLRLMREIGVDVCIVVNFNQDFRDTLAADFVRDILVKRIGADYVFVGRNFRFGRAQAGNCRLLEKLSKIYGFKLKVFKVAKINKRPISSTFIRYLIKKGKLKIAQRLLTRPVSILGTVIKGDSQAARLGFPTANIDPDHEVIPPSGVYAVRIILERKKFYGVCNIGKKPTFKENNQTHVEVHIFNFKKSVYAKNLEVQFIKKLRNEKRFKSSLLLAERIKKDIAQARGYFSRHN